MSPENQPKPLFGFVVFCAQDEQGRIGYSAAYIPDEEGIRRPTETEMRDACGAMAAHMDRVIGAGMVAEAVVRNLVRANTEGPRIVRATNIAPLKK